METIRESRSSSITRILVLGANGMLGNAIVRYFAEKDGFDVYGTIRSTSALSKTFVSSRMNIISGVNVENVDHLIKTFAKTQPDVVINCVGIVKQLAESYDPLVALPINSMLPHRLAHLAATTNARLIHISTDCVFSGNKGGYTEEDLPDATDLYGRSKLLGEVDYPNAITLRTSIIGHELESSRSLVNWFLSQTGSVKGFRHAIFSGLPTVEIARVIHDHVLPNTSLRGLYHLSVDPINKYDLLNLVAQTYGKSIDIVPDDSLVIDRSLDSGKFRKATGYVPKPWPELIQDMHNFG
jgi:dTDP-4-dehydrorhamnose reductase